MKSTYSEKIKDSFASYMNVNSFLSFYRIILLIYDQYLLVEKYMVQLTLLTINLGQLDL